MKKSISICLEPAILEKAKEVAKKDRRSLSSTIAMVFEQAAEEKPELIKTLATMVREYCLKNGSTMADAVERCREVLK